MTLEGRVLAARFRARRLSWVALCLTLAVAGSIAGIALTAARTTESAFDRVGERAGIDTVTLSHSLHPAEADEALSDLGGIAELHHRVGFAFAVDGVSNNEIPAFVGMWEEDPDPGFVVLEGRLPDAARSDEVAVNQGAVERVGLGVGDEIAMAHLAFDRDSGEMIATPHPVNVVGVISLPRELFDDDAARFGSLILPPAFAREHVDTRFWSETGVVLADPEALEAVTARAGDLGWDLNQSSADDRAIAADASRPVVAVLRALALLFLAAALLLGAPALARLSGTGDAESRLLSALGATRRQFVTIDIAAALCIGIPAAVLCGVAVALGSAVGAVGWADGVDPRSGVDPDWFVVVAVPALVVLMSVAVGWWSGARNTGPPPRGRSTTVPAWVPEHPVVQAGAALLVGDHRRRIGTSIVVSTLAVAALVSITVFTSALRGLIDEPVRYGFHGNLILRDQYGDLDLDDVEERLAAADVEHAAGFGQTTFLVNDAEFAPGVVQFPVVGQAPTSIAAGEQPAGPGEVLVGRTTLGDIGLDIGDTITLQRVPGPDDRFDDASTPPGFDAVIVGSPVIAPVAMGLGAQPARLDEGIWVGVDTLRAAGDEPDPPEWVVIRATDSGAAEQVVAANTPYGPDGTGEEPDVEWLRSAEPAEVRAARSTFPLVVVATAAALLVVAALIGQTRLVHVREQRSRFAMLTAIGFSRRQLTFVVLGQATTLAVVVLLLGVPLGLVGGRLWWDSFGEQIGVLATSELRVVPLLGVVFGVLLLTNLTAMLPAVAARRSEPAIPEPTVGR